MRYRSEWFFATTIILALLFFLLHMLIKARPRFTMNILFMLTVLVAFLLTERVQTIFSTENPAVSGNPYLKPLWRLLRSAISSTHNVISSTHNAGEFENRFWAGMAGLFSYVLFFVEDSPCYFISKFSTSLAFLLIVCSVYGAHNINRAIQRKYLRSAPLLKRTDSAILDPAEQNTLAARKARIEESSYIIDHPMVSGVLVTGFHRIYSILSLLFIKEVGANPIYEHERKIIDELKACEFISPRRDRESEFNNLLQRTQLPSLLYKIKDHGEPNNNRSALLKLICETRIAHLSVQSKSIVIFALQKLKLTAHKLAEKYVRDIILSTDKSEISGLKLLIDSTLDIHSMHKLIYTDITGETEESLKRRNEILQHFKSAANWNTAHAMLNTKKNKTELKQLAWKKIISDIDDTLYCSAGSYPAGADTRYPKHCLYPGVLAFYRELDLGKDGPDEWPESKEYGNLCFLSARPHFYGNFSEAPLFKRFEQWNRDGKKLYCRPTLLAGQLASGFNMMLTQSFEEVAKTKCQNYTEFASIYPEYNFVFLGDNGQGDIRTVEMIKNYKELDEKLHRVYIHHVIPEKDSATHNQKLKVKDYRGKISDGKIVFFTTYVEAAVDAYKNDLIKGVGLERVMMSASTDFQEIKDEVWEEHQLMLSKEAKSTRHPKLVGVETCKEGNIRDLNRALEEGNKILQEKSASIEYVYDMERKMYVFPNTNTNSQGIRWLNPPIYRVAPLLYPQRYFTGLPVSSFFGVGIVQKFRPRSNVYEVVYFHYTRPTLPNHRSKGTCRMYLHGSVLWPAPASTNASILIEWANDEKKIKLEKKVQNEKKTLQNNLLTDKKCAPTNPQMPSGFFPSMKFGLSSRGPIIMNAYQSDPVLPSKVKPPLGPLPIDKSRMPTRPVKESCWSLMRRLSGKSGPVAVSDRCSHADLASAICLNMGIIDTVPKEVSAESTRMQLVRGCQIWSHRLGEAILLDHIQKDSIDVVVVYFMNFHSIGYMQKQEIVLVTKADQHIEWKLHLNLFLVENAQLLENKTSGSAIASAPITGSPRFCQQESKDRDNGSAEAVVGVSSRLGASHVEKTAIPGPIVFTPSRPDFTDSAFNFINGVPTDSEISESGSRAPRSPNLGQNSISVIYPRDADELPPSLGGD